MAEGRPVRGWPRRCSWFARQATKGWLSRKTPGPFEHTAAPSRTSRTDSPASYAHAFGPPCRCHQHTTNTIIREAFDPALDPFSRFAGLWRSSEETPLCFTRDQCPQHLVCQPRLDCTAGAGGMAVIVGRPMSCVPGYFEVINTHVVGSLTIPRACIKWV